MSDIIEEDVTNEAIKDILENAALSVTVDPDGEMYVTDLDFPCWIRVDKERSLIRFRTYIQAKDDAPVDDLFDLARSLNDVKIMVKFTATKYEDGRGYLNGNYHLYHKFGLNRKNLVYSLRKFAVIFREGIIEIDEDDIYFN